jgi:hypothetical protein
MIWKGTMLPPLLLSVRVPTRLALLWRAHLAPRNRIGSRRRDGLSLLVIRLDGLGDVVLTTPLFRELKRAFPGSSCTVVVQDAFRPPLVTNPYIDEIIGVRSVQAAWMPTRVRSLLSVLLLYWSQLRGRRFDIAISPRWDIDDRLATFLCALADARVRVGYTEAASPAKQRHSRGFDAAFDTCLSAARSNTKYYAILKLLEPWAGRWRTPNWRSVSPSRTANLRRSCWRV